MATNNNSPEKLETATKKRNIFVDVLAILFGISSWIGVTSTFIQLPLLVEKAPEGWSLASYISITVQSANIGSFAYVLYQKYSKRKIDDGYLIYITLLIGCIAAISMSFCYADTVEIGEKRHSIALLVFSLMFALVGCLSSVLFMPYMGRFRECYLVTYMFGMGLNGFLSSIVALIQGVGGPGECVNGYPTQPVPLFGTDLYFLIVFGVNVLSTIAFILLNNLSICKLEYAVGTIACGNDYHYDESEKNCNDGHPIPDDVRNLSTFNYIYLTLAVVGLSGLGNGLFPGLMTYSCLPYGRATYHYAVTLIAIANPLAGFICMLVPHTSIRAVRLLSIVGLMLAINIFWIALQSPFPIFRHSIFGSIQIVSLRFCFVRCSFYLKDDRYTFDRFHFICPTIYIGCIMGNIPLHNKLHENLNCLHISISRGPFAGLGRYSESNKCSNWFNNQFLFNQLYGNICFIQWLLVITN